MARYDIAIVGGGIYGCSVAKHLSEKSDKSICVIEKEYHVGSHQSGRNSGVLTPGIVLDFEENPRMGHFAEKGLRDIQEYCRQNNIHYKDYGLLVVAKNDEEERRLEEIRDRKTQHGIEKQLLTGSELAEKEPHIDGQAALFAPESGAVDSTPIVHSLASEAMGNGVDFFLGYNVNEIDNESDLIKIETDKGVIESSYLVNTTGAHAAKLAREMGVIGNQYQALPLRGQYYELKPDKRDLIKTDVYPTPRPDRIEDVGIHFTRRPDNKVIIGPTGMIALGPEAYGKTEVNFEKIVETMSSSNFWKFMGSKEAMRSAWDNVNMVYSKSKFVSECQRLLPEVTEDDLVESYVGIINYLIDDNGKQIKDPVFEYGERSAHILMVLPGITSSISIGDYMADEILQRC
ncbi:FAD-dependent oxidoreductase [Haloferax sp. ATB1]|uniref:FAD-dependent oxidoreductase n=1 Tax=Haloferax sp. ATB1 TaxID=1508454 RepID=UPI0005B1E2A2|nr:FAD-dependent oxidoreductase [Haloferax sp. ATB1]